jgi:prepilin-type N-terminal cleavage/methylation domain-containing protein
MFSRNRREEGFTLIELLIVMALLGVLVAVLLPKYQDLTPEAKIAATQANLDNVRSAVLLYQAKHPNSPNPTSWAALVSEGFLRKIPVNKILMSGTAADTSKGTGTDPTVLAAASGDGGWLLNTTTGSVWCNVANGTLVGSITVNPLSDW